MTTRLSSKGQVVLPQPVRALLGLQPGVEFEIRTEGENVVLTPLRASSRAQLKRDRKTGLPTFVVPGGTPPLTSDFVRHALADFP